MLRGHWKQNRASARKGEMQIPCQDRLCYTSKGTQLVRDLLLRGALYYDTNRYPGRQGTEIQKEMHLIKKKVSTFNRKRTL